MDDYGMNSDQIEEGETDDVWGDFDYVVDLGIQVREKERSEPAAHFNGDKTTTSAKDEKRCPGVDSSSEATDEESSWFRRNNDQCPLRENAECDDSEIANPNGAYLGIKGPLQNKAGPYSYAQVVAGINNVTYSKARIGAGQTDAVFSYTEEHTSCNNAATEAQVCVDNMIYETTDGSHTAQCGYFDTKEDAKNKTECDIAANNEVKSRLNVHVGYNTGVCSESKFTSKGNQPGDCSNTKTTTENQPGASSETKVTTGNQPRACSDTKVTTRNQPGASSDTKATTGNQTGASSNTKVTTRNQPGACSNTKVTTGNQPGASSDTKVTTRNQPGACSDSKVTTRNQPGASCDTKATTGNQPGASSDTKVTTRNQHGAHSDDQGDVHNRDGTHSDSHISAGNNVRGIHRGYDVPNNIESNRDKGDTALYSDREWAFSRGWDEDFEFDSDTASNTVFGHPPIIPEVNMAWVLGLGTDEWLTAKQSPCPESDESDVSMDSPPLQGPPNVGQGALGAGDGCPTEADLLAEIEMPSDTSSDITPLSESLDGSTRMLYLPGHSSSTSANEVPQIKGASENEIPQIKDASDLRDPVNFAENKPTLDEFKEVTQMRRPVIVSRRKPRQIVVSEAPCHNRTDDFTEPIISRTDDIGSPKPRQTVDSDASCDQQAENQPITNGDDDISKRSYLVRSRSNKRQTNRTLSTVPDIIHRQSLKQKLRSGLRQMRLVLHSAVRKLTSCCR